MSELPEITRDLERFVAMRMLELDQAAWAQLTVEKRKDCMLAARRALKAERRFLARETTKAAA